MNDMFIINTKIQAAIDKHNHRNYHIWVRKRHRWKWYFRITG